VTGSLTCVGRRTATKRRPRWRALPERLRPPATTMAHRASLSLLSDVTGLQR
jgi:hypothetical protein